MANTKKNQTKAEPKAAVKSEEKVAMVQNMMANSKEKEADKQRFIYSAMSGMTIVRN